MNIEVFRDKSNKQLAKFIHTYLKNKAVDIFRKYVIKKKMVTGINYDLVCDNSDSGINVLYPRESQTFPTKLVLTKKIG
ncbi:hypothetical protein [Paramaledivibacter caminithermalis]|jgi:hypothetical protein|uniref:Uncharacterized protein n=1 Tax=Paramaledivibacter caminithermalis (strain DSM 15212 / CIP 107654 / DViRD3) TaxID=1121301 RepID=A0A1M6NDV8_PARC5|nr:hypothetical protein [Paramaledivibacter caminithermalis]SHJ93928.1 hypothetical protein SAMN02745912_01701 [Paramaledivibacter caminithermalis DSM 15212]